MPKPSDNRLKCSFCGKSQDQVKKLIAGPGVYICDECVDLCNEILDKIVMNGKRLKEMVNQISSASSEQSEAITNVRDAMGRLGVLHQENSSLAIGTADTSEILKSQAWELDSMVRELFMTIQGSAGHEATSDAQVPISRVSAILAERAPETSPAHYKSPSDFRKMA